MSAPFDRPELTDDEKRQQREMRDRLARSAAPVVDAFVMDNRHDLETNMTAAARIDLIVDCVVSALVDNGLIAEADPGSDGWIRMTLPDHLKPDVAGAKAEYDRIRSRQR